MAENLPPLPDAYTRDWAVQVPIKLYTEFQMKAYAAESVKVERKACADLCDSKARKYMKLENEIGGGRFERMARGAENCADDIRTRKDNHG